MIKSADGRNLFEKVMIMLLLNDNQLSLKDWESLFYPFIFDPMLTLSFWIQEKYDVSLSNRAY